MSELEDDLALFQSSHRGYVDARDPSDLTRPGSLAAAWRPLELSALESDRSDTTKPTPTLSDALRSNTSDDWTDPQDSAPGEIVPLPNTAASAAAPVDPLGRPVVIRDRSVHVPADDELAAGELEASAVETTITWPKGTTRRIECWVHEEGEAGTAQQPSLETGTIAMRDIARWLRKPPPKSLGHNKAPKAGLQLVCRRQPVSMEKAFDETTLCAIHAALGIPEQHEYLTSLKAGACGKYIAAAGYPVFLYHRSSNNGTISAVISYEPASNVTRGYVLMGPRISIKKICDEILSQFPYSSHPLLIPTVLIELTAADLMSELYHIHRLLAKAEDKTRFGDWELDDATADFPEGEISEAEEDDDKEGEMATESEKDERKNQTNDVGGFFLEREAREVERKPQSAYWRTMEREMQDCSTNHGLARLLGSLSCRFAFMNVAVRCSISMAKFTLHEMVHDRAYEVTPTRSRRLLEITNAECLRHRIELLLNSLQHMELFAAIDKRMQAQQNILFNLITQTDSNLNIEIARDSKELAEASKRDSTAMKIIAILTTVFLPGTFLATFFAMPLFDWSAISMSDVGTSHLWVYWAVAIPMTAVLMVGVSAFAFIQGRKNKEATRKAREKAGADDV
ncbi:hypothetical protein QBC34DRAFT_429546 [Podospora aff. communis PSN243]|uniref:Uncharacterized protein n=1 Tax=Podospora aff. communis PSN243 TaxID=3040156 RepID=A0AAV9G884_9PEZI|nr:hypothetical protein QBC34DRAFT_429546 [Podospora aff. communis PSN243]